MDILESTAKSYFRILVIHDTQKIYHTLVNNSNAAVSRQGTGVKKKSAVGRRHFSFMLIQKHPESAVGVILTSESILHEVFKCL